eukprot:224887_1
MAIHPTSLQWDMEHSISFSFQTLALITHHLLQLFCDVILTISLPHWSRLWFSLAPTYRIKYQNTSCKVRLCHVEKLQSILYDSNPCYSISIYIFDYYVVCILFRA